MTDLLTLTTDVTAWARHDDLATKMPTFVTLSEAAIRRDVRTQDMQVAEDITITDGEAAIPAGFLEARRLITDDSTNWALEYKSPDVLYSKRAYNSASGHAWMYTIESGVMTFRPQSSVTGKLLYLKQYDPLLLDTDTNPLLVDAYDVYLFGTLLQTAIYLRDDALASKWGGMYSKAVDAVNLTEDGKTTTTKMTTSGDLPGP